MALWMSRGAAGRACLNYYFCMWGQWVGKEARNNSTETWFYVGFTRYTISKFLVEKKLVVI